MTKAEIMALLADVPEGEQVAFWAYRFEDYQNGDERITPDAWNEAVKYFDYRCEQLNEIIEELEDE